MDGATLTTLVTAIGGVLAGVLGAPLVGQLAERWFKRDEQRGDELAEVRRDLGKRLAESEAECKRLRDLLDAEQEKYYQQREAAILAARDVAYYQRLAHLSTSAADRGALVARDALDALEALPNPTQTGGA